MHVYVCVYKSTRVCIYTYMPMNVYMFIYIYIYIYTYIIQTHISLCRDLDLEMGGRTMGQLCTSHSAFEVHVVAKRRSRGCRVWFRIACVLRSVPFCIAGSLSKYH